MGASKAKNSAKRRELNREKRARQAQRRAEREHPTAAAIAELGIQAGTTLFAVIKATAITLEAR